MSAASRIHVRHAGDAAAFYAHLDREKAAAQKAAADRLAAYEAEHATLPPISKDRRRPR